MEVIGQNQERLVGERINYCQWTKRKTELNGGVSLETQTPHKSGK